MAPAGFCTNCRCIYSEKRLFKFFFALANNISNRRFYSQLSYRIQIYIECILFQVTLFIKTILLVVFLLVLNFLVTAPEANQLPGGSIGWSFGLTFYVFCQKVRLVLQYSWSENINTTKRKLSIQKMRPNLVFMIQNPTIWILPWWTFGPIHIPGTTCLSLTVPQPEV